MYGGLLLKRKEHTSEEAGIQDAAHACPGPALCPGSQRSMMVLHFILCAAVPLPSAHLLRQAPILLGQHLIGFDQLLVLGISLGGQACLEGVLGEQPVTGEWQPGGQEEVDLAGRAARADWYARPLPSGTVWQW
jgi:hypothetical protein